MSVSQKDNHTDFSLIFAIHWPILPRDAMRCAVLVIVILSARLSVVHPSDTLVDCVHIVRPTIMISSQYGSPMILVSGDITFIPKSEIDDLEWPFCVKICFGLGN